ncbi:site-2 protease family protein [Caenibacillus caldisaponilyticus]|uniref:site-2 protease family protein n=1 Tax=Caenibacillus caldisaponilyticus TaxID=1674942 RepID=UPI0009889142|nr:site-2 protease family protein [Caenibacillus caldisaponilyticus]
MIKWPPLPAIRFHPVFWIVLGAGVLTGRFYEVAAVFFIVILHEAGHFAAAKAFHWRVASIELLPFGGVMKVDEVGTRPLSEELIVTLSGPLQHLWLPAVSFLLCLTPFWNPENHALFMDRNWMILAFNMLPVWPLDGGKLMLLVLSRAFPYRRAYRFTLVGSALMLGALTAWMALKAPYSVNFMLIGGFLAFSIYKEWADQRYIFLRFLLARWNRSGSASGPPRTITVPAEAPFWRVFDQFYKDATHCIKVRGYGFMHTIEEPAFLDAFFSGRFNGQRVGDLFR